ncbi:MAG: CapA family protein [bacterium]|nr:CapA family protein [bacterium]
MLKYVYLLLGMGIVVGSIYLFLQKPAPPKYVNLIPDSKKIESLSEQTKILFVGDIMLDRSIRKVINEKGLDYIFNEVKPIFLNVDFAIGNLEGAVTDNESISIKNYKILRFTFATSTLTSLKELGFDGFNLANNHTLDFYQSGFDETINNLNNAELFSFGHPLNNQNLSSSKEIGKEKLCFVGYHSLYESDTTAVLSEIRMLKFNCTFITVSAHWGVEYEAYESADQQLQARSFVDAGADLVIGHHPHVIQPIEVYKGKAIFYSLGNFVFDQDFSLATRQGIAVRAILEEENITYKIIPIEMFKGKLYYPTEENIDSILLLLNSKLNIDQQNQINSNKEIIINR